MYFLMFFFLYFGCFSGGNLGFWGGGIPPPQEIAGNNTESDTDDGLVLPRRCRNKLHEIRGFPWGVLLYQVWNPTHGRK